MNQKFRLKQASEFLRVRRFGKSYAHPLVVLVVLPTDDQNIRIAVTAGRSIGTSVQRNRAKRMLREAVRPLLHKIKPGWKMILIARGPVLLARLADIQATLIQLFIRANIYIDNNES